MDNQTDLLVFMRDVYSNEYYKRGDGLPAQVLQGISFEAGRGQTWSVVGNSVFEVMLLTEIMAGARAYQSGQCSLAGRGMTQRKRTVLPHTLYIGSTNMLFNNMKVLEYLMFATSHTGINALLRQQQTLDTLMAVGLEHMALKPIDSLSPEEKAAVALLCAALSPCLLLIMNLPRLKYDAGLIKTMAKIAALLRNAKKTLILTTEQLELAQAVSTDVLLVQNGAVRFNGALADFLKRYDKVIYSVQCEEAQSVLPRLAEALPRYTLRVDETRKNTIEVYDDTGTTNANEFYLALGRLGLAPQIISRNERNLRNAYKGFLRENGLS